MWFRNIFGDKGLRAVKHGSQSQAGKEEGLLALSSGAFRQLNRLQLNTGRSLPGFGAGARPSLRRRPAADFREHRMYTPGDDVRFVDWRASARQEHVFIKQGEHQKDATVYLLLDCSASMTWGDPPKSRSALSLAAALGYLALANGDRLVVAPLASPRPDSAFAARPLGPVTGKGQFPGLLNYLRALPFRGRIDFLQGLQDFTRRGHSRGGLVLFVTDLLAVDDLARGLARLPAPTWEVMVFHLLHPAELNPSLRGDFEMQDIETGQRKHYEVTAKALETYKDRLQAWRLHQETTCLERNTFYTMIPTDWTLEGEILPHLREANVVKPL